MLVRMAGAEQIPRSNFPWKVCICFPEILQLKVRNVHGKMAFNSDMNMRSADQVQNESSPQSYSFMALSSSAKSRITAEQEKVEGDQKGKSEEVLSSCLHRAPDRFCNSFGGNVVPQETAQAGATGTSAALPEATGSKEPSSQRPCPQETPHQQPETTQGRFLLLTTLLLRDVNTCWQKMLGK